MTPIEIAPPSGPATVGVGAGTELAATVVARVGVVRGVGSSSARGTRAGAQAKSKPSAKSVASNLATLGLVFIWSFKLSCLG